MLFMAELTWCIKDSLGCWVTFHEMDLYRFKFAIGFIFRQVYDAMNDMFKAAQVRMK